MDRIFKKYIYLAILLFMVIFLLLYNKNINKKRINIAVYSFSLKNGGVQRITALLINNLSKFNFFNLYLFINIPRNNEYRINKNIKRILIKNGTTKNLIKEINNNHINIIIYQFFNPFEIKILNSLKNVKTIIYIHTCFLVWIYLHQIDYLKKLYNSYKNSNYIISLIPFENDYLFKKWGIKSILLNNFITYDYDNIIPSDLSSKTILMIGRGNDKRKRFDLGIKSMKYIVNEIPDSKMKIISDTMNLGNLRILVKKLKLEKNIKFVGYTSKPEKYFKKASLHIFPSCTESFGLALSETKIYGIPNIITGLDYILPAKGGVINIFNDNPRSIAKAAIKILQNYEYRKKLGKQARLSMKKFKNELTTKRWVELILAINKGKKFYNNLIMKRKKISNKKAINIIQRQIRLLKKREPSFRNISFLNIINLI